jgi:CheY-like chemotaxis protein
VIHAPERPLVQVPDDRESIQPADQILLIVEDDPHYARLLVDLAREQGFKVLAAMRGAEALDLARKFKPTAVSLDVFLPDMLGWTVLSHLKKDPETRHIPVQMVTLDEDRQHGLARGAFSFVTKPASTEGLEAAITRIKDYTAPRKKRLLVVEDNAAERMSITALLGSDDVAITTAATGAEALAYLTMQPFDCAVLDLRLPDMSGFDVLDRIREHQALADLPVVVFTGKELSPDEDARLRTLARSVVVKGVESPERLLDETALFLHRIVADLPEEKQQMLRKLHESDEDLQGKSVLVVDDDTRNIFALSSVLERRGMRVLTANTGRDRADGHHDAGDGRLRDHARDPQAARPAPAADHRADRESHEGRPREVPRGRRVGLPREARQHRAAPVGAARLAAPVGARPCRIDRCPPARPTASTSCWSTTRPASC